MAAPASEVRLRVAAILPHDGGVVLVRHSLAGTDYHLLPGGGVEPGESLGAALKREIVEETGLLARPVRPLFISDAIAPEGSRHMVQITFLGEVIGGSLTSRPLDPRVAAAEIRSFDELSALDLRPPMADAIAAAAARGFAGEARYLGPLWSESTQGHGACEQPGADG